MCCTRSSGPGDKAPDGLHYDTYYSIHRAILDACALSGGKSLVVAAYVNYRNPLRAFNPSAVRLLDCVVFASGGARIELGNGGNMLSDEYFPADTQKRMDGELTRDVRRLYDFLVAYENLLRDGQRPLSASDAEGRFPQHGGKKAIRSGTSQRRTAARKSIIF